VEDDASLHQASSSPSAFLVSFLAVILMAFYGVWFWNTRISSTRKDLRRRARKVQ
jgi:hypothetical protein